MGIQEVSSKQLADVTIEHEVLRIRYVTRTVSELVMFGSAKDLADYIIQAEADELLDDQVLKPYNQAHEEFETQARTAFKEIAGFSLRYAMPGEIGLGRGAGFEHSKLISLQALVGSNDEITYKKQCRTISVSPRGSFKDKWVVEPGLEEMDILDMAVERLENVNAELAATLSETTSGIELTER
jgi:hypothetical protein